MPGRFAFFAAAFLFALAAQAQIALKGASQAAVASTAGGSITHVGVGAISTDDTGCPRALSPAIPGGVNGDLLIAVAIAREDAATVAASAGWTLLRAANYAGQDLQGFIFYRFATGADALTLTESGTCSTFSARVSRFRGVDAVEPFISVPLPDAGVSMQNSNNIITGSETTVAPNAMLLVASFVNDDDPVAQGGGWNASHENALNVARDLSFNLHYQLQTTAGAKTVSGWGLGATDENIGIIFSLRPAEGLSIARPAATATGDVMVASVAVRPGTIDIAPPPGWVLVRSTTQAAGTTSRIETYYKVVTDVASEPASYGFTLSGGASTGAAGGIASFSGVDTGDVVDADGGNVTPSGLTHTAGGISTTVVDTMLVGSFEFASSPSPGNWNPGSGSEVVDQATLNPADDGGLAILMSYEPRAAIGATGNRSATASGVAGDTGTAHLLALKPVSTVMFDITSGNYAVACAATPIAVTIAARDPGGALKTTFASLVNLSTSSGTGNWSVALAGGTLNNGAANDGAATYQFVAADGGMVRLNLAVPAATTLTISVQDTATGFVTASSTIVDFVADGYAIVVDPIQVAGRNQTLTVEHRVSPGCGLSTANGHGGNNTVKIWLGLDPSHPSGAALPSATGAGGAVALGTTEPGGNNITLNFGGPGALAPGQAPLSLSTSDVGKYVIHIRDTSTARRGSSSPITTRPFALAFTGMSHGTTAASAVLAAAGDGFPMTLGAYLWQAADDAGGDGVPDAAANVIDNGLAAHFAWSTTVAPSVNLPGVALGELRRGAGCAGTATIASGEYAGGAAAPADWCYSEAGNVLLAASAENYLNSPGVDVAGHSGLDGTGAAGGHVGRFRPKHFAVSGAALTNRLAAACAPASAFSYMDEGFQLAFALTAQNAQGATTQNYSAAYAKLVLTDFAGYAFGARSSATNLSARLDDGLAPAGSWVNGVADVAATTAIARAAPDNPDGPFASLQLGIAPSDADGVQMDTLDLDIDGNGSADRRNLGVATEIRFGRLRLQNAVGIERLALNVPVRVQYWNGSSFVTNALDSCTSIGRDNIALGFGPGSNLGNCETALSSATIALTGGVGVLRFAAPGPGNNGSVLLEPQLDSTASGSYCPAVGAAALAAVPASRSYLLGRWDDASNEDADAATAYDDDPAARAAFGVYGAQPRNFIFFRENY
jgi:hypothetical protein